jgi:hypothetical protein
MTRGSFGQSIIHFNTFLWFSHYYNSPPYLFIFSVVDGMHIVGLVLDVMPAFL